MHYTSVDLSFSVGGFAHSSVSSGVSFGTSYVLSYKAVWYSTKWVTAYSDASLASPIGILVSRVQSVSSPGGSAQATFSVRCTKGVSAMSPHAQGLLHAGLVSLHSCYGSADFTVGSSQLFSVPLQDSVAVLQWSVKLPDRWVRRASTAVVASHLSRDTRITL